MTQRDRIGATIGAVGVTLVCLSSPSVVGQVLQGRAPQDPTADGYRFVTHTIATGLTGGYQPVVVDLNRDRRPDVIALSTRLDELAWYENPGWQKHVLPTGLHGAINLAAQDLDDDGIPEVVVAHEFGTTHASSPGVLTLLTWRPDGEFEVV